MTRLRIDVDAQRALNRINRYSKQAESRVKSAVARSTLKIDAGAKKLAPVDTGRLRGSIQSSITDGGLVGEIKATADYAAHVEFGTRKMEAQPFLFPASEQERQNFENAIKQAVRE